MVIDILFAALVGYAFFVGFNKGIIKTVFTVLAYLIGFVFAMKFYPFVGHLIENLVQTTGILLSIISFIVSFVFIMLLIRVISGIIERGVDAVNLEFINNLLGGLLFGTAAMLVYAGFLIFLEKSHILTQSAVADSMTYSFLRQVPTSIAKIGKEVLPFLGDFWDAIIRVLDKAQESVEKK